MSKSHVLATAFEIGVLGLMIWKFWRRKEEAVTSEAPADREQLGEFEARVKAKRLVKWDAKMVKKLEAIKRRGEQIKKWGT